MKISGEKTLVLTAEEVAVILDSLAVQPYNKVYVLIAKVLEQARDRDPPTEAEPVR